MLVSKVDTNIEEAKKKKWCSKSNASFFNFLIFLFFMLDHNVRGRSITFTVRPEKKTTFLLQQGNARPGTILQTVEYTANLGWTVLTHLL